MFQAKYPKYPSFAALLEDLAARQPEAPALRFGAAGCKSYLTFQKDVQARAEALKAMGKRCLGVLCDGSYACVREIFAAALAGMQLVLLDENVPEEELPALIRKTDIDALWGEDALDADLTPWLTRGAADGAGRVLFFTSGTTDSSKAVVLSQASLCASAWNGGALLPLSPEDRLLCLLPLNHVFGFVCGLLWGLSCGACVALGRGARYYAQDLKHFSPTAVAVVPMLLSFLLKQEALNQGLRLVLIGAGDCPPALPAAVKARGIRVSFGYGLTECSSGVALSLGEDPYAMQICPDFRVRVAEDGELLIENESCMMQGYCKAPAATAAVLRDGVLRTGDLGCLDEKGLLHVTGRKKEILVFPDGTKLFLPEYEARLRSVLPERDFAVIELKAAPALVLRGRETEREAVTRALEPLMRELPLSRRLKTVILDPSPLPRTATGKIQRWILQQKVVSQYDKN